MLLQKVKIRVRMAKMVLRGVNFSCSLIVLSMISTTFSIFNATKAIPARNNLPAWASGTNPWPQMVLLVISCVSLAFSLIIFYAYWKGGHNRAQKTAVYYTVFAVFFFTFSIVMWAVGAGILHSAKQNGNGQDLWGWSCKDNKRRTLFQDEIHYALVCRLQVNKPAPPHRFTYAHLITTLPPRTGPSSAPSSKSSSKQSPSQSTP